MNWLSTCPLSFLSVLLAANLAWAGAPQLKNSGFEDAQPAAAWLGSAAQPAPDLLADKEIHKEGSQSLQVASPVPVRFSLRQEIVLPPGSLWRASVWVKDETSARAIAHLQIETPAGDQGWAGAADSRDWRQEEVLFRVPSPGRVTIRLRPFDQSAGKVWLDDVRLESVPEPGPKVESVILSNERLSQMPIDIKQGGQFIEPLIHLTPSMIAQQVESTSFEEEPEWKARYKKEIDKPFRPWYPDGSVHVAQYSLDSENPYNGKRSQRIDLPLANTWAGISQDGFYLQQGHSYQLKLHLRSEGSVRVRASLHGEGGLLAAPVSLGNGSRDWQGAQATFLAKKSVGNATLTIEMEGPGTLWLDRIYLIDSAAVLGLWRPDVVQALQAVHPGVIRFGGSTLEVFEWDKSLGDWDVRVPYVTDPWGGSDPNFVGVEEFVQLSRYVGAEPLICVRWTGKTPQDAAAEVEYFNGPPDSKWGKVRARNGHREPYQVKYWQIGNEIGGGVYDASVKAFAEAMKAVDPSIKILSSFPSAEILQSGGGYLDYLCPHHYSVADLVGTEGDLQFLREEIRRHGGGKNVRVAVTEWNTTAGEMGLTRGMLQTLGNALSCSRYQNLLHRYSDLVEIAIRSNLSDSFGSGMIQPGPGWFYLAPTYDSQVLYQRAAGSYPLQMVRDSTLPRHLQDPDLSATLSPDGKTLRLYAVNSTAQQETLRFELKELGEVRSGTVFTLHDTAAQPDSEAMNSHDAQHRVTVEQRPFSASGTQLQNSFPPYSVTLLELQMAPAAPH